MTPLNQIPFADLTVGDAVLSAQGKHGRIVELIPKEFDPRGEGDLISMEWETGTKSPRHWHFWLDKVLYLGKTA